LLEEINIYSSSSPSLLLNIFKIFSGTMFPVDFSSYLLRCATFPAIKVDSSVEFERAGEKTCRWSLPVSKKRFERIPPYSPRISLTSIGSSRFRKGPPARRIPDRAVYAPMMILSRWKRTRQTQIFIFCRDQTVQSLPEPRFFRRLFSHCG
jgi:hypothetical protein